MFQDNHVTSKANSIDSTALAVKLLLPELNCQCIAVHASFFFAVVVISAV